MKSFDSEYANLAAKAVPAKTGPGAAAAATSPAAVLSAAPLPSAALLAAERDENLAWADETEVDGEPAGAAPEATVEQPLMFEGTLKEYQVKGGCC